MALLAALCAIGLVVLAVLVDHAPLPIDERIRDILHVGGPVPPVLDALNTIGVPAIWDVGVVVLVVALWLVRRRFEAAGIAIGLLVGEALAISIKLIVDRPRPPGVGVADILTQASFPSGHVTRAAVTAVLIVVFWPGGRWSRILAAVLAILLAALMGLARIVAGEHWPTDVLGAYLVTGVVGGCAAWAVARFRGSAPPQVVR
jgi:undecaprenyl-diphosphatase